MQTSVRPTTQPPAPMAKRISVSDGASETIRGAGSPLPDAATGVGGRQAASPSNATNGATRKQQERERYAKGLFIEIGESAGNTHPPEDRKHRESSRIFRERASAIFIREQILSHLRLNKPCGMMGMRQQEMDNFAVVAYAFSCGVKNDERQIQ